MHLASGSSEIASTSAVSPMTMAAPSSLRQVSTLLAIVNGGISARQQRSRHCKWRHNYLANSAGGINIRTDPLHKYLERNPFTYRNRKCDVSTNVLAACGPDLRFIYVLPGWEGSAGDSRVLRDALRRQNKLEIPTGKYFLVDAGYTDEIKGIWATRVTDGGWRRSALNAAAAMLSTSFNVNVTSDNVKNRIKLWRSWYGIVSDIPGQSGFDWDDTKHMITIENENAWNEYCTVMDLCAKDRATGHGAKTNEMEFMGLGATAIDLEEPSSNTKGKRQGSTSCGTHPHKRKMGEKEGITTSLDKMANSFNRMVEKMEGRVDDEDIQEVLREAALIPDLNRQQWVKAIKWLADDPKQLAIVKALPIHQKTNYVLTHLGE
ncbi:hypothetical protein D0Y65_004681 [Glycine soja]|uniref:DDE Tnp4 domain-containing protein n=1 Tax=Glycine soja TaxID=3848 RepID=A0A445LS62_GLYSO|nr:hypothetical protein D0Y65_004681 [Glycine soja]